MEQPQVFTSGLQLDTDPQAQPVSSLRDSQNWILTVGETLLQERDGLPLNGPNQEILAMAALNEEVIVFSQGDFAEVGVLSPAQVYTPILQTSTITLHKGLEAETRVDYRGHRLVYWVDGSGLYWLDLDAPTTDLPAGLDLLTSAQLPTVSLVSVEGGGSLPTGIYQAAATLLTASKNETSYSLFTNPVPILNEDPASTARQLLDGAPPQTPAGGSIIFHLTNLDPSYSYVQLVIATYLGSANTPAYYKLKPVALNGRDTLDITYYSTEQHQESTTLELLLAELPNYVTAKHIEQKDGHLLLANLTTGMQETVDWQAIANKMVLGPATKDVLFSEAVNITRYVEGRPSPSIDNASLSYSKEDYKKPELTATSKGLQRGEVYSFCFIPLFGSSRGSAYHIPASTLPGAFSTYTSLETTPATGGYLPGYVTHHRMPTLEECPLLVNGNIRILGVQELVKPDFSSLLEATRKKVTGYLIGMQARTSGNRSILAQGILNPLISSPDKALQYVSPFTGHPHFEGPNHAEESTGFMSKEYAAFYSPETTITQADISTATTLTQVGNLSGVSFGVADKRTGGLGEEFAAVFLNYTSFSPSIRPAIPLLPPAFSQVAGADGATPPNLLTGERYPIMASGQNGFTLLKVDTGAGGLLPYQTGTPDLAFRYEPNSTSSLLFRQAGGNVDNGDGANWKGVTTRPLYNVSRTLTRQYGSLDTATYFPVAQSTLAEGPLTFFNGDTFIGKVALLSATQEYTDGDPGIGYLTMNYFFCESTVNVNYRHSLSGTTTTLPYFPKSRTLWSADGSGVMQYPTSQGHPTGYNKQYSFTNTLNPFFPKDSTIETVTSFTNRILYSAQAVEGEQLDAYRLFKANDYHDLPKDKGPITKVFTLGNSLYTHTTGATYKNFFNETTTTTTSEGEVALGNGGLFNRPSQPLTTVEGGYAGCQHPQAAITTPQGHFFPDATRGKVFVLQDGLKEITTGLRTYFRDSLPNGSDYRASYDYRHERYVLAGTNFTTISYSAFNQRWQSFHTYSPTYLYATATVQYLADGPALSLANAGEVLPASLTQVSAENPLASKLFTNGILQSSQVATSLLATTNQQTSEEVALTEYSDYGQDPSPTEVLYRYVNDQYQVTLPRDLNEGRLQGKWLAVTWNFASNLVPTVLRSISTLYTPRSR